MNRITLREQESALIFTDKLNPYMVICHNMGCGNMGCDHLTMNDSSLLEASVTVEFQYKAYFIKASEACWTARPTPTLTLICLSCTQAHSLRHTLPKVTTVMCACMANIVHIWIDKAAAAVAVATDETTTLTPNRSDQVCWDLSSEEEEDTWWKSLLFAQGPPLPSSCGNADVEWLSG